MSDVIAFEFRGRPEVRNVISLPLDKDSAAIVEGSLITTAGATAGFVQRVDANSEVVIGVAIQAVDSAGTVDGDKTVLVDVSTESVYEVKPSTGSVAAANLQQKFDAAANGKTVLFGVTAANGDIECIKVDAGRNTLLVRINPAFTSYTP